MFIVWGKKQVVRKLGFVADFCPLCREFRAFQLSRIGMASHVYYISSGEGELAGHLLRCTECGVELGVNPTRYIHTEKKRPMDLEELIRSTFPNLREAYTDRLELEAQLKVSRSGVGDDEYKRLLMEPFALLNPRMEQRFTNSTEMDKQSGLGCLGTVLIGVGLFVVSFKFQGHTQDKVLLAALGACVLGTIYTFIQLHFGPGRFFRSKLLPPLVKCLAALEPTRQDLIYCIERCKGLGMKIGKVAQVDELWARLGRT